MKCQIFTKLRYLEEQGVYVGKLCITTKNEKKIIYEYEKEYKNKSKIEVEELFVATCLSCIHSIEKQKKINLRHDNIKMYVNDDLYYNIFNVKSTKIYETFRKWLFRYNIVLKKKKSNLKKDSFSKSSALLISENLLKKKNLIIFDLEFNNDCRDYMLKEVISIGAVKLDQDLNIIDKFSATVKPTFMTKLTNFCKRLTGLTQEDIDSSKSFLEVMNGFENWIGDDCPLIQWSENDKAMLDEGFKINNCVNPFDKYSFIDFQQILIGALEYKEPIALLKALNLYNIQLLGEHHNSLYDSINTANIFIAFQKNINNLDYYKNRLEMACLLKWDFNSIDNLKTATSLKNVI